MQYKPAYGFYADTITPKAKLSFTFSSQKTENHITFYQERKNLTEMKHPCT